MPTKYIFSTLVKNIKKPTITGVVVALIVQYSIIFLIYQWFNAIVAQNELKLAVEIGSVKNLIEKKFNENAAALASLSLAIEHDGTVHEFENVAKDVMRNNPGIKTIAILPGGVYEYFYPKTSAQNSILGFNLMLDGDAWTRQRIQDAIHSKSAVFIGPFPNISKDSVIITIYPIYIRSKFWGITMLTNPLREFMVNVDEDISKSLNFTISNINPTNKKEYVFYSSHKHGQEHLDKVSHTENFSFNSWKISGYYPKPSLFKFLSLPFLLSIIIALVTGAYVNNLINTPKELKVKVQQTTRELEKYDLRFKTIYENAPIGIVQIDFNTRKINEANKKFCQIVGIDRKEILERNLWEFLPQEFYESSLAEFQEVISGEKKQIEKYLRYTNRRGVITWVHGTVKPIRDVSGKIENLLLVVEDVTAAEVAKAALADSEEQYRNLFNNSPIALSEYDYSEVKKYLTREGLMDKSFEELYRYFSNNTESLKICVEKLKPLIINAKAAELFGFSDINEFLNSFQYIPLVPESWEITIVNIASVSNRVLNMASEGKIVTKDGLERYLDCHWNVMPGHEEEFDRVIVTMTDITKIKQSEGSILKAQKKISESEKQFRSLFEESPIALWEEDFSSLQKYFFDKGLMNKSYEEIFRYFVETKGAFEECFLLFKIISVNKQGVELYEAVDKSELLKNVKFLLSSPHAMHYTILALTALSNNVFSSKHQTSINTLSGKIKYIDYHWNVMPGYENDFGRVIVAMIDITQQKEAELKALEASEDLKISQERFRSLFYDSPIALWEEDYSQVKEYMKTLDIWGKKEEEIKSYFEKNSKQFYEAIGKIKILSVNREALSIYNTDSVEKLREHFANASNLPESRGVFLMQFAELGSGKLKFRNENTSVNEKGELIALDLNWNVLPGYEDSLMRVIVSTNDITQIKRSEFALRKAKKDLQNSLNIVSEQNKQLMQFSYIVSHNLRSHAANLQSLSELIIDPENTQEEKNEYALHLHNITKILADTMEGLNEVTQIQTSGNLTIKPLNLKEFVRKTIDILSNKIAEKKAVIKTDIGDDVIIKYYQPYLESVLLCFISNAIKYSSPERQPLVEIKYSDENGLKILRIKDNGIEIDLEKHGPRMFGLFKTFTSNPDSRGIGLYIAKHQIEVMQGRVSVESTPDVGTTFTIVFRE